LLINQDPNKPVLRLYEVPLNTFEDEGADDGPVEDDENDEDA
jgi:translation initiation factor 3 subunit D